MGTGTLVLTITDENELDEQLKKAIETAITSTLFSSLRFHFSQLNFKWEQSPSPSVKGKE